MRLTTGGVGLAVAAAIALALSGCGETVIDSAKAEATIKASLESKKSLDRRVDSVECPSDVKVEAGASFECSVDFAGGESARAVLKIRDSDADLNLEDVLPHSVARAGEESPK